MTAATVIIGFLAAFAVVLLLCVMALSDELDKERRRKVVCTDCWLVDDYKRKSAQIREQWATIDEMRNE